MAFDDGEGREDIAHVVAVGDAVEMEKHGVEARAQVQAAFIVPREGRRHSPVGRDVPHVAGEGRHVVRRVGQFQHRLAHDLARGLRPEAHGVEAVGRHDGKLFDDVPVEVCALGLLTSREIKGHRVQVRQQ